MDNKNEYVSLNADNNVDVDTRPTSNHNSTGRSAEEETNTGNSYVPAKFGKIFRMN
jgi:hypothetical protein